MSYLFGFYKRNENGEELIDVLLKNKAGRSALTDAFQSKDVAVIELCLNHTSASEERLMDMSSVSQKPSEERTEADKSVHAVEHHFLLSARSHALTRVIKMRELPITKADHPFGSEEAPEDDSTGNLQLFPRLVRLFFLSFASRPLHLARCHHSGAVDHRTLPSRDARAAREDGGGARRGLRLAGHHSRCRDS